MSQRKHLLAVIIMAVIGLAACIYLTYLHHQIFTGKLEAFGFCGISRNINCEAVSASPYSEWFGVPVAWIGAMLYLLWLLLAGAAVHRPERHSQTAVGLILMTSAIAVAIDIYFAQIMFFTIGSLCLPCLLTYVLNLAVLILAFHMLDRPLPQAITSAIKALTPFSGQTRYGFVFVFVFVFVATVGTIGQFKMHKSIESKLAEFDESGFMRFRANAPRLTVDTSADPFLGAAAAKLTIVEFSDFQCPHCQKAHVILQTVLPGYMDRVKLVFKNLPLGVECNPQFRSRSGGRDLHPAACGLAQLGEAAQKQGRFWPLHDLIFERQTEFGDKPLSKDALLELANDAGLDIARLEKDMDDPTTAEAVRSDLRDSYRLGIQGTPVFLFNGLLIRGMPAPQILQRIIEIELRNL